jgi:CubicO group peptidase (beta-lactamase class C family)
MKKQISRVGRSLALALAIVSAACAAETPKLAPVLQPFVDSHTLAGAVVLVADPDKILGVEAVGWRDVAAKKPMQTDCLFWIASQSKPITAAALMILVDEGKVNVDDPVEKYLPEFKGQQVNSSTNAAHPELKAPRHPIRVREILSHTSGLPFKSDMEQPTLDLFPLAARVQSYAKLALLFEPGTKSQYSNAGINTAGRIVEVVSGMRFEKFLDERIFTPLGMSDTTFWPNSAQLKRLAKAYKPNAKKDDLEECPIAQLKYPLDDRERQPMPAGGLFSTAHDVSIFYRMLANNGSFEGQRILSGKAVAQMTSDQSGAANSHYGFGIGSNGKTVTHGGAYNTASAFDRERKLITIFLGQHAGWMKDGKAIIPTFQKAAAAAFAPAPAKAAQATDDAHLTVGIPGETAAPTKTAEPPTLQLAAKENIVVFKEPGRYGGWPANHGLWQWGDELVVGFQRNWYKYATNDHAIDRSKPHEICQTRSLDGGRTWKVEDQLPFADPKTEKKPAPLPEPLDFTAPDFALLFRFGGLHVGPSWFYVSGDRCRTWRGPFKFAVEGIEKICTRTDLVVLGPRDCLMFGSAAKSDDKEGRVFCARTTDGGLHWKLVALIGPEPVPGDFAIMPSTVRLPGGALITTIRHGKDGYHIRAWRSDDLGQHWTPLGAATGNIGGNPPALVLLQDGRLCLSYGYRRKPTGVRARISSDEGRTWGPEIILRDDGLTGDLGYPRSLVRPDGRVLTVYYFNGPRDEDRTIQGTFFTPPQ